MNLQKAALHRIYHALQKAHPNVLFFGDDSRREIALTFDDGPHPRDTPQVLDALARHDVRATFFLIGKSVEQYPELVKQIYDSGHQLGIHCYRHIPFPMENASILKGQLDQSRKAIADACSISLDEIRDIRPPYGFFTKEILTNLNSWGYRLVLWDNMPLHFVQPASWTIRQIVENPNPGSIIVLHDGNGHGSKVTSIVDTIIPMLKQKGYGFIKIEEMERKYSHGR
jgi:peptidoglycan/xylan/chitin deacetylase (PgdA/CDA1 family)